MSGWAERRQEWLGAADGAIYSLSIPAPWRGDAVLLFASSSAPLSTQQLQDLHNHKVRRQDMLRCGEAVAAVVPADAAGGVDTAIRHFLGCILQLKAEHAPALAEATIAQVCALIAATFGHAVVREEGSLPAITDAVGTWRRTYDAGAAHADLAAALLRDVRTGALRALSETREEPSPRVPVGSEGPTANAGQGERSLDDVLRAVAELSGSLRAFRDTAESRLGRLEVSRGNPESGGGQRTRRVAVESPQRSPAPSEGGPSVDDGSGWGDGGLHRDHPDRWDRDGYATGTDSD
eukprot:gene20808-63306_t